LPSPRIERRTPTPSLRNPSPRPPSTIPSPLPLQSSMLSESEPSPEAMDLPPVEDTTFSEFVEAPASSQHETAPPSLPQTPISEIPQQDFSTSAPTNTESQTDSHEIPHDDSPPSSTLPSPNKSLESQPEEPTQIQPSQTDVQPTSPITTTRPVSISPSRQRRPLVEKTVIRRSPSKVPGDYDPVTGYYRRKSEANVRVDEEEQIAETWKQSLGFLEKD